MPTTVVSESAAQIWQRSREPCRLKQNNAIAFGYEPICTNIDQSPFHHNEAGSQELGTLALKGAYTVPLIESHAATRCR